MNTMKKLRRQISQSNGRLNVTAAAKSEELAKSLDDFND